jgi:hypothetical protein
MPDDGLEGSNASDTERSVTLSANGRRSGIPAAIPSRPSREFLLPGRDFESLTKNGGFFVVSIA